LSDIARRFIAGLLRHAPEITAVTNQLVNSYKRLVVGFEAPVHSSWARNNRSALVRVPVPKRGKESLRSRRGDRAVDPACDPYRAGSVLPAAGLRGVAEGYELPPEAAGSLYDLPNRSEEEGRLLPTNLAAALDEMARSELVREALGEHIFEWFLRNKRSEWEDYRTHVSRFELQRYLRAW